MTAKGQLAKHVPRALAPRLPFSVRGHSVPGVSPDITGSACRTSSNFVT